MKKIIYAVILAFTISACTEEVTIDEINNPSDVRLVIEANMDINKTNTTISTQQIKLSKTGSFYSKQFLGVTGATINVTDQNNNSVGTFLDINPGVDDIEDGIYTAVNFKTPNIGDTYFLSVIINSQTYTAKDTYTAIEDINKVTQETLDAFEKSIQININIDNEIGVDNYYLFEINTPNYAIPEYGNGDDSFISNTPGENDYDFVYLDEEIKAGENVNIKVYGISKSYNNYLTKLLATAQGSDGPFSTAPATVRGNILNTTNNNNFALGFFSLNQFVERDYVVK